VALYPAGDTAMADLEEVHDGAVRHTLPMRRDHALAHVGCIWFHAPEHATCSSSLHLAIAQELERDMWRIARRDASGAFVSDAVQHPLHAVFNAPVPAHQRVCGGWGELIQQGVPLFGDSSLTDATRASLHPAR